MKNKGEIEAYGNFNDANRQKVVAVTLRIP